MESWYASHMKNQTKIEEIKFSNIGVLLVGYNRPELLQKRITELSNSMLENIHISIDGGSESHTLEMQSIQLLAKKVLKERLAEFHHHQDRKGLVLHITDEISKVLLKYKYIIVLEDDVKTAKNFDINMLNGLRIQQQLGYKGIVAHQFLAIALKINGEKLICVIYGGGPVQQSFGLVMNMI